jgi:hypothetical protein
MESSHRTRGSPLAGWGRGATLNTHRAGRSVAEAATGEGSSTARLVFFALGVGPSDKSSSTTACTALGLPAALGALARGRFSTFLAAAFFILGDGVASSKANSSSAESSSVESQAGRHCLRSADNPGTPRRQAGQHAQPDKHCLAKHGS